MVARITEPKNIRKAVYYNENKVKEGVAKFIGQGNFLKPAEQLTLGDKLQRYDQLTELNQGVKKHTLHISLNFHPSEKITHGQLLDSTKDYMDGIGFGNQPYLVYEHHDSGHPHVHVVTTSIRDDGSSINFHNIGRNQSSVARKAVEKKYGLIEAERQIKEQRDALRPLNVQKLQYGKTETKNGIARVLAGVLDKYKFASLPELNAVLSLYNVRADSGAPGGRIQRNKGMVYRMITETGSNIGKPIKASSLPGSPTLDILEKKFKANTKKSPADIKRVKGAIDWAMVSSPKSLAQLSALLKDMQVRLVRYRNGQGLVYGLTFVDMLNKSVLNGSDIAKKEYSAKKILEKLGLDQYERPLSPGVPNGPHAEPQIQNTDPDDDLKTGTGDSIHPVKDQPVEEDVLEILMDPEEKSRRLPWELRNDKKKGKNKSQNR